MPSARVSSARVSSAPVPSARAVPEPPAGFRFGAATAACRIEGTHDAARPRLLPEGTGPVSPKGLDLCDRLIDELPAAGVEPAVTLHHWDLPQALEDRGGWRAPDTAEAFADYASLAAERYGDRGERWISLDEPYCSLFVGYGEGRPAPRAEEGHGALAAAHRLLVALGLAVRALRAAGAHETGITLDPDRVHAASSRAGDLAAVAAGVDARGCSAWSLLDNFEWARGHDQRFGPVLVDHDTLNRTPKDGYHWSRGLITAHRERTKESTR